MLHLMAKARTPSSLTFTIRCKAPTAPLQILESFGLESTFTSARFVDCHADKSARNDEPEASFLPPRILGIAVLLVVLFVDFRAELDLWSAVALKSTKSPL